MAEWEDKTVADRVLEKLKKLPPLVRPKEVDRLTCLLAEAAAGKAFIVQGGDCAERFIDCEEDRIQSQITLLLQMGMICEHRMGKKIVTITRMAGQYGKPRSKPTEVVEGHGEVMSFKGDNINGFSLEQRKWDPERLLQGYFHSAATLNCLRSFVVEEEASELPNIDVDLLKASSDFEEFKSAVADIKQKSFGRLEFFTSHEAMQLDLEEALTRKVGDDRFYNLSAHIVWIGDRTRQINGAHVEYFRGLANPIGCKIGPSMKNDELQELVKILNPRKEEGHLMLITRYGAGKVEDHLPGHIEAVKASGVPVVWQCDGVHGNIITTSNKLKSRRVDDIVKEISTSMSVHSRLGTVLAGVHLEVTGQKNCYRMFGWLCRHYRRNADF